MSKIRTWDEYWAAEADKMPEDAREWYEERPAHIKLAIKERPPFLLYRLKSSGANVFIIAYGDDGTLTVALRQHLNPDLLLIMERDVFGILPGDLEPLYEMPDKEEVCHERS